MMRPLQAIQAVHSQMMAVLERLQVLNITTCRVEDAGEATRWVGADRELLEDVHPDGVAPAGGGQRLDVHGRRVEGVHRSRDRSRHGPTRRRRPTCRAPTPGAGSRSRSSGTAGTARTSPRRVRRSTPRVGRWRARPRRVAAHRTSNVAPCARCTRPGSSVGSPSASTRHHRTALIPRPAVAVVVERGVGAHVGEHRRGPEPEELRQARRAGTRSPTGRMPHDRSRTPTQSLPTLTPISMRSPSMSIHPDQRPNWVMRV